MKTIYISSKDHRRLSIYAEEFARRGGSASVAIQKLRQELNRAVVLDSGVLPPETVTLNSRVVLRDLHTHATEEWIITMPEHANPEKSRISILAPVGIAVLGYAKGDEIEWETPGGVRTLKIENVQQGAYATPDMAHLLYG